MTECVCVHVVGVGVWKREHTATVSCPNYECSSSSSFLGNGKMGKGGKSVTKGVAKRDSLDLYIVIFMLGEIHTGTFASSPV